MDFLSGPTDQKITFGSRGLRLRITRFTQLGSNPDPVLTLPPRMIVIKKKSR